MRRASHVDSNQGEIVRALRAVGATVESLAAVGKGVPDLLVGYHGRTYLLEVKDGTLEPARQRLRTTQVEWHSSWRGYPVNVVHSAEEALKSIGAIT